MSEMNEFRLVPFHPEWWYVEIRDPEKKDWQCIASYSVISGVEFVSGVHLSLIDLAQIVLLCKERREW